MGKNYLKDSAFKWTRNREQAAISLANGHTQEEAAESANVSDRTIRNWLQVAEFSEEVDRLTLMLDIASKAERLRIAKRVIRQMTSKPTIETGKDLLDWLKYAQAETDGIHLDLTDLAIQINAIDYRAGLGAVAPSEARDWWEAAEDKKGGDD